MEIMPGARRSLGWVVGGGLIAGACDIVFACGYWALARDVPTERILQSIASGVLGKAGYEGGWASALLGLALHFIITLAMSGTYYAVSRRLPLLWQRPFAAGAAYGVLLYVAMNFVVVPLSNAAVRGPANDLWTWLGVAAHVLLVGIPIALCTRRAHLVP